VNKGNYANIWNSQAFTSVSRTLWHAFV